MKTSPIHRRSPSIRQQLARLAMPPAISITVAFGFLPMSATRASETAKGIAKVNSIYDISVNSIAGKSVPLTDYKGKTLLIVNTASECGYTPQYKGLESIFEKYQSRGFVILGFPANDFGSQEPGSNVEIKKFCENKFHVTFPLFEKGTVKGEGIQPLYRYLTENAPTKGEISWNFEKFLIARDGKIVGRYKSAVTPESPELAAAIEKELKTH